MAGYKILGIGEVLWDCFPDKRVLGGAPLNFIHHVCECGGQGYILSAVGNDSLGDETLRAIGEGRVNTCITRNGYPTGTVQVSVDERGVPSYHFPEPVAWDHILTEPFRETALDADAVCFGTLAQRHAVSRGQIRELLRSLPRRVLRVLDLNLRGNYYGPEVIRESLDLCDILKINDQELLVLAGILGLEGDLPAQCRQLTERYRLDTLVLTCGTQGSYLFSARESSFMETPRIKLCDTVGAGDSFLAAVVTGVLHRHPLREIHCRAVAVSAFVCTRPGGTPAHDPDVIDLICSQIRD